jgi:uncharacterized repeat protein (TIGR03803 family)
MRLAMISNLIAWCGMGRQIGKPAGTPVPIIPLSLVVAGCRLLLLVAMIHWSPGGALIGKCHGASLVGYEQLYWFAGGPEDGEFLFDTVAEGSDGWLYGTALNGGPDDGGLVFKLNKDGTGYDVLHYFANSPTNGLSPWGGVIQGSDGKLYGATRHGGTNDAGVIFSLNTNGTEFTIVRHFTTNTTDGAYPLNGVIEGDDGRLYGRTLAGGVVEGSVIFGMNKDGTEYKVLRSFNSDMRDYYDAYSGLTLGSDGLLYGTTYAGGVFGNGSVFRLNKDGSGFETLYSFQFNALDGGFPLRGVHEASDGVLYGTTSEGGRSEYGTLFRLNRDGTGYAVLRHFTPDDEEGYLPVAEPVEGPGGLLYGSTYYGGPDEGGTLYSVRKDGSEFRFLRVFLYDNVDGTQPNARLLRGSDGALYGTTFSGGGPVYASVFRITPFALKTEKSTPCCTVVLEGFSGHRYEIEASDSLPPGWSDVATVTNLTGTARWIDTNAVSDQKLYRARALGP